MIKVKKDLTGMTFGQLTVLSQAEDHVQPNGKHLVKWLCECSCEGHNQVEVLSSNLTSGITRSCGCLQKETRMNANKKENKKDLSGEYGIIWSSNTNEEIYFDLEDADKILKHTWAVNKGGYPSANIGQKTVTMHRFLGYYFPDHYNQNKLDNRKANLKSCTPQENTRNKPISSRNKSGIIGVNWNKRQGKWHAQIGIDYKVIHLGFFENKEDAIRERLKAEAEYFKDFAPQRHLFKEYGIEYMDI